MMTALFEANNTFALNFLKEIDEDDSPKNVFYSPLSLYCALAMVLDGAMGNTAEELREVLSLARDIDVHENFQYFIAEFNSSILNPQSQLKVANQIFGKKTCDFLLSFKETCMKFYSSNVEELDFANDPEASRKYINDWVEKKTEGKIVEVVTNDSVTPLTSLMLVNAVYFSGKWEIPFDEAKTIEKMFKISKEKQKPVQMMYQRTIFYMNYIEDLATQVLILPYDGGQMDMVILLPDENMDLKLFEKGLTSEKLIDWLNPQMMYKTEAEVLIPRFTLTEHLDTEVILQKMGLLDAFDGSKADFSRIAASNNVFFSKVIHRAYMEVNEGSMPVASTTETTMRTRYPSIIPLFLVDHPFLFLITEKPTNTILFFGKVISP